MLTRVLLTTDALGGVWRYSMEIARGFATHGIETVLAVLGPAPGRAQSREASEVAGLRLLVTGLELDWLAKTPDEIDVVAQALAVLAGQTGADTVQLHAPALAGHAAWPVPVVSVVHSCVGTWWRAVHGGPMPPELAWRADATSRGIGRVDVVVAPSLRFGDALRDCYGVPRPIEVILNGRTSNSAAVRRREHALTVGRLWDEGKNVAVLDAAAGRLGWPIRAAGPAIRPDGATMTCHYLKMLGPLDEEALAKEYGQAAIFVSVALYEPFGLAVLEAAQAGCALVLSDIPTFRELWDEIAIFVPADRPDRIADALEMLLRQPATCARRGKLARQRAALFSARQMIDSTLAVHQALASPSQTAA